MRNLRMELGSATIFQPRRLRTYLLSCLIQSEPALYQESPYSFYPSLYEADPLFQVRIQQPFLQ